MGKHSSEYTKRYNEENRERIREWHKQDYLKHKEKARQLQHARLDRIYELRNKDLNNNGITKQEIRYKSFYYLKKYGKRIKGYEIHHCCGYDDPYKFIYVPRDFHRSIIHVYLRQHNISADEDHYDLIKHLLDDTCIKYNID